MLDNVNVRVIASRHGYGGPKSKEKNGPRGTVLMDALEKHVIYLYKDSVVRTQKSLDAIFY